MKARPSKNTGQIHRNVIYCVSHMVGDDDGEVPPVPIPNTVVKLIYGDNTWLATAREDNSTRTLKSSLKRLLFVLSEKVV